MFLFALPVLFALQVRKPTSQLKPSQPHQLLVNSAPSALSRPFSRPFSCPSGVPLQSIPLHLVAIEFPLAPFSTFSSIFPPLTTMDLWKESLTRLVARGSAIAAEIVRLGKHVPPFMVSKREAGPAGWGKNAMYAERPQTWKGYDKVLFDLTYLKMPETFEDRVNNDPELLEADLEFQEEYGVVVGRFYAVLESVVKYLEGYNAFVKDLVRGFYIQHSVDQVLRDLDGAQLMAEALYLYGVMLFLLEKKIPGQVREKFVVAHLRMKGEHSLVNLDQVIKLCKTCTGRTREEMFFRLELDREVSKMILGKLMSEDIYSLSRAYPNPDHRSAALGTQASMLAVVLYFHPEILHEKKAMMREIADKFFHDNWVIPLYLGFLVDLADEWKGYTAAEAAIKNTLEPENVASTQAYHLEMLKKSKDNVEKFLTKGLLTDEFVLDNMASILKTLREANVTTRWLMIHRTSRNAPLLSDSKTFSPGSLLDLMLTTSQLEYSLNERIKGLLARKEEKWEASKSQVAERMGELSAYFTGTLALTRVSRNDTLVSYFARIKTEVESLDYSNATLAGRRIQKIISALQELEQYNEIDTSLQIKQFLRESRDLLFHMVRAVGLREDLLTEIEIISDNSYSWELVMDYKDLFHQKIKDDPKTVLLLRPYFKKLVSVLDIPLMRISQCGSSDAVSVAQVYSSQLLEHVRALLEVVPKSIFDILLEIAALQSKSLPMPPSKIEITRLADLSLANHRFDLAKLTHRIGVLARGVLSMDRTLLGTIDLDPKDILEQGMRSELVTRICRSLETNLIFPPRCSSSELGSKLSALGTELAALRKSFEYVQDYLGINGLKVWNSEYHRIVEFYTEMDCGLHRRDKGTRSKFQSRKVPIPRPTGDGRSFLGRLETAILQVTFNATFSANWAAWFSRSMEAEELLGTEMMIKLENAIGIQGLLCMDRILGYRIKQNVEEVLQAYSRITKDTDETPTQEIALLHQIAGELTNKSIPARSVLDYAVKQLDRIKVHNTWDIMLSALVGIGQSQLLREKIRCQVEFTAQTDNSFLYQTASALNDAIILELKTKDSGSFQNGTTKYIPLFENLGISSTFAKIFVSPETALQRLPELFILLTWKYIGFLEYDSKFETLIYSKNSAYSNSGFQDLLDGIPLIAGIATVTRQFPQEYASTYLSRLSSMINISILDSFTASTRNGKDLDDCLHLFIFAKLFCKYAGISNQIRDRFLPPSYLHSIITTRAEV